MLGLRSLRRHRRRIAAELVATLKVAREEPHAARTIGWVVQTAVKFRIKPQDLFLYDLDRRPAADVREYVSKRAHTLLQDALNPAQYHHLAENKLDYHVACSVRGVPAPPVLAVVDFRSDDGRCAQLNCSRIESESDMAVFLGSLPTGTRLIFKSLGGSFGRGLLSVTTDVDGVVDIDGQRLTPAAILRHCEARRAEGGFLVQRWLAPHQALRPLMPGRALGTVRVVTVLVGGQVQVPFAYLKIPVGNNAFDAFNHGTSGNLMASVDVANGRLGPAWAPSQKSRYRAQVCQAHPDTGVAIEGFCVPNWLDVLQVTAQSARAFPELRTLGWDVAVTSDGIFLLEANHHWDPHALQVLLRRGLRPAMEALLAQAGGSQRAMARR
jgi:hypothetical protein